MKPQLLSLCLVTCLCGVILGSYAAQLSEENLESGDLMLSKSIPGEHEFYCLWPGDGRRADDPLNDLKEVFDTRIRNVSRPTLMVMTPENPNGKAVIIFPGGGYGHLATRKEGSLVGQWLNRQGITAFVVKYRVPKREGVNAPLQDAQRAIRFVRGNAKQFGINPNKVGVMGFSAGGHLCAMTVHHFDVVSYAPADELDRLDCKPNFASLIYPAYLGAKGKVSEEVSMVKDASIPIYITISQKDGFIDGVETYVPILKEAKVDYEYHVYPNGGHGTGLDGFPWTETCEKWLSTKIKPD